MMVQRLLFLGSEAFHPEPSAMIRSLFGPSSVFAMLRQGLGDAAATHRRLAAEVAGAEMPRAGNGGNASDASATKGVDLQQAMVELADTQLRFDATSRLLQKAYSTLRIAMRDRG